MPPHEMTVAELQGLLTQLRDDDVVVPNAVANLAVVRKGAFFGYVDFGMHKQVCVYAPAGIEGEG